MLKCLSECVRRRCLMLSGRKESENSEWEFIFFSSRSLSFLNSLLTSIIAQLNEWRKKTTWNGLETEDESSSLYLSFFFSVDDLWLPHFIFDNFNTYFICANNKFLLFCSAFFNSWNCFSVSQNREKRPLSIFVGDSAIFVRGQTYNREEWEEVLRPSSMSPFWSQIMLKVQRENWSISTVKVLTILSNSPAAKKLIRLIAHEN